LVPDVFPTVLDRFEPAVWFFSHAVVLPQ
jgi:hypothetical protein